MSIKSILRNKKNILLLLAALLVSGSVIAQQAPAPAAAASNGADAGNTLLQFILLAIVAVLGFVLWGMGQVITMLSKQYVAKKNNGGTAVAWIAFLGLSALSMGAFAQEAPAAASAAAPSLGFAGLGESTVYLLLAAIAVEVFGILYLSFVIRTLQRKVMPKVEEASNSMMPSWFQELDKKIFTRAVPVEKEADVLLDHDYDGIKELDNALPPWWKYGFYVTILVAFVYIYMFHVSHAGLNPTEEYNAQMTEAQAQLDAFNATNKDKVDEANLPTVDEAGLSNGKELFATNCFPCHGKLGEGGAGPNLTDDYWIHKGSLSDVYQSIKHGYPDKGMQAWSVKFNPKEILQLAAYIKTLRGTKPAGAKEPQGDLYEDAPAADSSAAKVDSSAVVKK